MSDQVNQQAVVVQQDTLMFNKSTTKLALFNEDGTPLFAASKNFLPVDVSDPRFKLSGVSDNTQSINSALTYAASNGLNVHFSKRPLNQPYVIGGSGII